MNEKKPTPAPPEERPRPCSCDRFFSNDPKFHREGCDFRYNAPAPPAAPKAVLTREEYERHVWREGWPGNTNRHEDALLAHDTALRAEVERVTDVAYAHCSRADAREADIERITAHYAGAMELANRKVSLMTELLRRAVPLVAFCAPKGSTLAEDIRKAIHE